MTKDTSKRDNFIRISAPRTEKAVHHIGLLKNLGSHAYENTDEDAAHIITQLVEAVDAVAEAIKGPRPFLTATPDPMPDKIAEDDDGDDTEAPKESPDAGDSDVKAPIFKGATVPANFPNEAEGLELIRVGPMIGEAMEDLLADDPEAALAKLRALMAA
jgi:hypothetical protein